ncbi:hypothetical protein L195_g025236 [Trifolium pratense]|uniref:RNase H type-1 domain-containing protein n=1 Tax=Trifolium pratense TaxID=57577 RepID=A0A2K3NFY0_TRIPR|nr:hypothetical protein L195_g025236 [Trifolium pratense]
MVVYRPVFVNSATEATQHCICGTAVALPDIWAGAGVCVILGWCTNISKHHLSILEGDAMTLLEAIPEATSRGWSNIIFESDSKIVFF